MGTTSTPANCKCGGTPKLSITSKEIKMSCNDNCGELVIGNNVREVIYDWNEKQAT